MTAARDKYARAIAALDAALAARVNKTARAADCRATSLRAIGRKTRAIMRRVRKFFK